MRNHLLRRIFLRKFGFCYFNTKIRTTLFRSISTLHDYIAGKRANIKRIDLEKMNMKNDGYIMFDSIEHYKNSKRVVLGKVGKVRKCFEIPNAHIVESCTATATATATSN